MNIGDVKVYKFLGNLHWDEIHCKIIRAMYVGEDNYSVSSIEITKHYKTPSEIGSTTTFTTDHNQTSVTQSKLNAMKEGFVEVDEFEWQQTVRAIHGIFCLLSSDR